MPIIPRISTERARDGDKGSHFAERQHSDEDDTSADRIRDESRRRAAFLQRFPGPQEQTGADSASDGYHLDLARGQLPGESVGVDILLGVVVEFRG